MPMPAKEAFETGKFNDVRTNFIDIFHSLSHAQFFSQVPLIMGTNKDEGVMYLLPLLANEELFNTVTEVRQKDL